MSRHQTVRTRLARFVFPSGWTSALVVLGMVLSGLAAVAQGNSGASPANPYGVTAPGVVQQQQQTGAAGTMYGPVSGQGGINQMGMLPAMNQQPGALPTTMLYPDPKQYVLGAGDLVNVRLYDIADYFSTGRVSSDSTIELPLIGSVSLLNLTIRQAEDLIGTRLKAAGMYKNPDVIMTILESVSPQSITLVGEVHGLYPIQGKRNLLDVLAASGGLPASAGHTISIIRPGVETPILVDIGTTPEELARANVPVYPRDTIFVSRAGFVYVVGAFKNSGAFPLQPGHTTLMQMAALAGGPAFQAKYDDMRIVRTIGTQRSEVKIDIRKVLYGEAPDPEMLAGDIIFLPTSKFKSALANGGISTLLGVVSVIVYSTLRN